jgi:ABC-type sugar transport system substrate-binding protein
VLYVNPMAYGANPGVDAIGHGLDEALDEAGIELRVAYADFREPDWPQRTAAAVREAVEARVEGVVLYALAPGPLAEPAAAARAAGLRVFTFERPPFPVTASLVYPNFNHGLYMAEHLASLLRPGARVAVIGGPEVSDDIELVLGLVHGLRGAGLELVGEPESDRHRNHSDVEFGGYEAALRVLEDFARLDGLVPYNDETMFGALRALDETGRTGEMRIVSRNGTPRAVQAVREGRTDGTWDLDVPALGRTLGALVARSLAGEELDGETAVGPIGRMITRENAGRWRPWEERVRYRDFRVGLR